MRKTIVLITALLFLCNLKPVYPQSIFEDADGYSTIELFNRQLGQIKFSSAGRSITFSYGNSFFSENFYRWYLISVGGRAVNSTASIFRNGNISPEANIKLNIGIRLERTEAPYNADVMARFQNEPDGQKKIDQYIKEHPVTTNEHSLWLLFDAGIRSGRFNYLPSIFSLNPQVELRDYEIFESNIGLNFWHANIGGMSLIAGTKLGFKTDNNIYDLAEVDIRNGRLSYDFSGDVSFSEISYSYTAYTGEFNEFDSYLFALDIISVPHPMKDIALNLFSRTPMADGRKPLTRAGIGIFFLKNSDPLSPIGGISFEFPDLFDAYDSDESLIKKMRINLLTELDLPFIK